MNRRSQTARLIEVLGLLLVITAACSRTFQGAAGPQSFEQNQDSATTALPEIGSSRDRENQLTGLEPLKPGQTPSEERVADDRASGGITAARTGTVTIGRRLGDDLRQEEGATASAGLKDVFFEFDSWSMTEEGRQVLTFDADWLNAHPQNRMTIEGHCDERGTQAYNLVLGEKRAKAIRTYLANLNVEPGRLAIVSYGKDRPFCQEHGETCYQQNRRGHMVVRAR